MSAADWKIAMSGAWRAYNKGVPYTASEAETLPTEEFIKEIEDRILKAFGTGPLEALEAAWSPRLAMPVHQAPADMRPFFPAVYPPLIVPKDALIHRPVSLAPGTVNYAYNAADRKAKIAKNKRRSRARWRRREARRLEQELLCMLADGDPEREASEAAARALPALAPEVTARGEEGKPAPGAGMGLDDRVRYEIACMNADQRRAVDDDAGLVPLRSKPAEPEPRPYVPMKWGEHD